MDELAILSKKLSESAERNNQLRSVVARQTNAITQMIGDKYPSRPIVEYALKTQEGSVLNLCKAQEEFFKFHKVSG